MRTPGRVPRAVFAAVCGLLVLSTVAAAPPAGAAAKGEKQHWSAPTHMRSAGRGAPTGMSCGPKRTCWLVDDVGNASSLAGTQWGPRAQNVNDDSGPLRAISCGSQFFCATVGDGLIEVHSRHGWHPVQRNHLSLTRVSCGSPSFCLATDAGGTGLRWNGTRWVKAAGPSDSVSRNLLSAYDCVGDHFCLGIAGDAQVLRYDGHRWHRAGQLPQLQQGIRGFGESVSCSSPTSCMVAGPYGNQQFGSQHSDIAWRLHHGHWSIHLLPTPTREGLTSVSCSSKSFCVVADSTGLATTYAGSWGDPARVFTYGSGTDTDRPWWLSCPEDGYCVAVDPQRHTFILRGAWKQADGTGSSSHPHLRVSCTSARFCMALDGLRIARVWNGSRWKRALDPRAGANPVASGLSCTSSSFCLAIAPTQTGSDFSRFNGQIWAAPRGLPSGHWDLLSCASTTYCLAADSTSATGAVLRWSGSGWQPAPAAPFQVSALSCERGGGCVAGGADAHVSRLTGSTGSAWSDPIDIDPGHPGANNEVTALSCPTKGFCLAQDAVSPGPFGNRFTVRKSHGHWGTPTPRRAFDHLSCSSPSLCVGHILPPNDKFADVRSVEGDRWSPIVPLGPFGYSTPGVTDLSCAPDGFCVAVDQNGNAFARRP